MPYWAANATGHGRRRRYGRRRSGHHVQSRAGYPALPMDLCSIQVMCAEQRDREHNGQGPRGRLGQAHRREY
jgi:hypothetical protein